MVLQYVTARWARLDRGERGVAGAAVAVVALLGGIAAGAAGVPALRGALAVAVLTVVPGAILVSLAGVRLDGPRAACYVVGSSLVAIMVVGVALNAALAGAPLGVFPFRVAPLTAALAALTLGGALALAATGRTPSLPRLPRPEGAAVPYLLFLGHLLPVAVVGAVVDKWYHLPGIRLLAIGLVALVPVVAIGFEVDERYGPVSVYAAAVALFYQTTLSARYFTGGDASIEYLFARRVVVDGLWDPTFAGTKTSLLSLVVIHPVYSVVGGLDVMVVMKVVYPLLFAVTPVAMYLLARRSFSHEVALLSSLLVTFLHPYFHLLTQNTRTGTAILFVTLFALQAVDGRVEGVAGSILSTVFLFGIAVSHYGVAAMFLGLLGVAWIAGLLDAGVGWSGRPGQRVPTTALALFGAVFVAWYLYTAQANNFEKLLTVFVQDVLLGLDQLFASESNATQAVQMGFPSLTYRLIRYEYVLLTLASGVGFLHLTAGLSLFEGVRRRLPALSWLWTHPADPHPVTHAFAAGSLALLAVSFAPVDLIGVARIYALAAVFIVPYGVFEARFALSKLVGVVATPAPRHLVPVAAVVAALLLINSGFVSATVTHGRSPQPTLEHERISESGTPREVYHLYRSYTAPDDVAATGFLFAHGAETGPVFHAARHGGYNIRFFTTADWAYHPDPRVLGDGGFEATRNGYAIVSEYSTRTGNVILVQPPSGSFPFVRLESLSSLGLDADSRVYDNGDAEVYWSPGNGDPTDDTLPAWLEYQQAQAEEDDEDGEQNGDGEGDDAGPDGGEQGDDAGQEPGGQDADAGQAVGGQDVDAGPDGRDEGAPAGTLPAPS